MKLKEYLELRKKGWDASSVEMVDLPAILERYRSKVNELQAIIESLDDSTLGMEINFRVRA